MSSIFNKLGLAAALSASIFSNANATNTTIELGSIDQGIYDGVTASHNPLSTSAYIQQDSVYASRNFFVFDLTGLNMANLVSLEFYTNNAWNYSSENSVEYSLYDITSNISDLRNGGNGQYAIYSDLGSGISYSNIQLVNPGRYDNFVMTFNQSGIDAAKATNGLFAFGGAFASQTNGITWLFGDNENLNAPLGYGLRLTFSDSVTAVPEPRNYMLLLAGLALVGLSARRRLSK